MRTVHKIRLQMLPIDQLVHVHAPGTLLHVGVQGDHVCLWADVDDSQPLLSRRYVIRPTGAPLEEGDRHAGTVLVDEGALVLHVFEVNR